LQNDLALVGERRAGGERAALHQQPSGGLDRGGVGDIDILMIGQSERVAEQPDGADDEIIAGQIERAGVQR
jgi:hypothetical protein